LKSTYFINIGQVKVSGRTKQNLPIDISQNEPMGRINENSTDIQEGLSN